MRPLFAFAVSLFLLCPAGQLCTAQEILLMDDEKYIELALDMIRKGVQQEDTTQLSTVIGPGMLVRGENLLSRYDLTARVQAVFNDRE